MPTTLEKPPVAAIVAALPQALTPASAFDPAKTRLIILTWPDNAVTVQAAIWINRHWSGRFDNVKSHCQKGQVDVVRCTVAEKHCLKAPAEIDTFVFMDRDMRPEAASDPVLTTPGDVVACQYETGNPRSWALPNVMHLGLVKVSRRVIETLAAERDAADKPIPLFAFQRTEDNRSVVGCECSWFAGRVVKAGFNVLRAGWCGHK